MPLMQKPGMESLHECIIDHVSARLMQTLQQGLGPIQCMVFRKDELQWLHLGTLGRLACKQLG